MYKWSSKHLLFIVLTTTATLIDQEIIWPVIQRNANFCDPESILLSMLTDKDIKVREKAVSNILNIRNSTEDHVMTDIRPFILPSIKRNPENYFTMIDGRIHLSQNLLLPNPSQMKIYFNV